MKQDSTFLTLFEKSRIQSSTIEKIRIISSSRNWYLQNQISLRVAVLQFSNFLIDTLQHATPTLHLQVYQLLMYILPLNNNMQDAVRLSMSDFNQHLFYFCDDMKLRKKKLDYPIQSLFKAFASEFYYNYKGELSALYCEKLLRLLNYMFLQYRRNAALLSPFDSQEFKAKLDSTKNIAKIITLF